MVYTEEGRYEIVKELGYDIYTRVEGAYNVATLRPDILPVPSQVESQAVTEGEQAELQRPETNRRGSRY